jgi:hypothetical protein
VSDILKFAKVADLDVMFIGSIGVMGIAGFLLGRMSEKVVCSSKCLCSLYMGNYSHIREK